ncbi:MAG: TonB-dependent receptor plug domain-containing protein [Deltaproteobacteria bacterium]|nr:TonB-dependent receptor plug domain-containing protein [Deltaproteobacteria bacterium]
MVRPGTKGSAARSFESLAETTPGAANDRYGSSLNGTTSPENNYVIDGVSVNDPAFGVLGTPLSIEFVEEVNVISGGYMPEYGRATGGVLDVVTKQGSNDFRGSVFTYLTPGALEGPREKVRTNGQTIGYETSLISINDFGFDLGGPILKDKL